VIVYRSRIKIGPPLILVKDIDRVLGFYRGYFNLQQVSKYQDHNGGFIYALGFRHHSGSSDSLPLILLQYNPDAKTPSPRSAGLFHFAILLPDRESLASTYLALSESGMQFDGFADHLVSESLYLRDPENNGIEIYRDRPSEEWPRDSNRHVMMDTLPLNLQSLLSETNNGESRNVTPFPNGGIIGHMHLRVTNLERSIRFYHEKLGLDMTADWTSMGAAFLSEGGYHHHIGINTWFSLDGEVHQDDETGLKNFIKTSSNASFFNSIKSNILNDPTSGKQRMKYTESNQFTVTDPDGIPINIKME